MMSVMVRRDVSVGAITDGISRSGVCVRGVEPFVRYAMSVVTESGGCINASWVGTRYGSMSKETKIARSKQEPQ